MHTISMTIPDTDLALSSDKYCNVKNSFIYKRRIIFISLLDRYLISKVIGCCNNIMRSSGKPLKHITLTVWIILLLH